METVSGVHGNVKKDMRGSEYVSNETYGDFPMSFAVTFARMLVLQGETALAVRHSDKPVVGLR